MPIFPLQVATSHASPPPPALVPDSISSLEARLAALAGEETPERVDALNALGHALPWAETERRFALATEARDLAERLGYAAGRAAALVGVGWARHAQNDSLAALPPFLEAEADAALLPEAWAFTLQTGLASVYSSLGDFEGVFRTLTALLDQVRAEGDAEREAWTLHGLSHAASDLGDAAQALDLGRQSLAAFEARADERGTLEAHVAVGTALRLLGRLDEARAHHEASLALGRAFGHAPAESRALHDLGLLALAEGEPERALPLLRDALAQRRAADNPRAVASSLLATGAALHGAGRTDEALATLHEALALADTLGARLHVSRAHLALADAYDGHGDPAAALRHLRRHMGVREELIGRETTARLQAAEAQAEARRARSDSARARQHAAELEALLAELHRTQARLVQSEKVASLGRLTAGIAHELKNPLNFVTNFAGLSVELVGELEAEADPEARRELLDDLRTNARTIEAHGRRADAIVSAMMAHARGGTGEPRPTDLAALVRQSAEAARQVRAAAGASVPEITFDLDAETEPVTLVPEEIGWAVAALIDNALRAVAERTGDAGVVPAVSVRVGRQAGTVEVVVEDNGSGMTDEVRARAFEPFFTTRPTGEGTGLGLSLAWDVAQGHGGTLTASPADGGGARFALVLPAGPPSP